jgi:methionyl-tRNA synthetase
MTYTQDTFYVTTPIYYVTAKPHLGSLYSTILADVASRYHALKGEETFFLTGTDEHGQKIAQAADKAGKDPQSFVDGFIDDYKQMWNKYHISYDHFIRTTDEHHKQAVQEWIDALIKKGDIYKSYYKGWYCLPCESYENEPEDTQGVACSSCERDVQYISEESYFFRLSAYQDALLDFYKSHPDFITPKERLKEVISFVESGLKDLSISRTTISWGIPFLNDPKHVTYVWADALNNYITAIGYGKNESEFDKWWPANLQILGKDIVRFHAIYWPAFLMASDLDMPRKLLVHGWLKVGDHKMSKSRGNVVDPDDLYQTYGADEVRYYLTRHMALTQDSQFSTSDLEKSINNELANDLGNLVNRLITLAYKYDAYDLKAPENWSAEEVNLRDSFWTMIDTYKHEMDQAYFYRGVHAVWKFINEVNAYFHARAPWKVAKNDMTAFRQILSATAHALHGVAYVLSPIMPEKMDELFKSLGIEKKDKAHDILRYLSDNPWNMSFMLHKIPALFTKHIDTSVSSDHKKPSHTQKKETQKEEDMSDNTITIDDVAKVELRVGYIESCHDMEKSDKLYQMTVDFGELGTRTILAGIKKYYAKEDIVGKKGIFVYNLKPRKMLGVESQGMMLLAKDEDGQLQMATVSGPVPHGTRLS